MSKAYKTNLENLKLHSNIDTLYIWSAQSAQAEINGISRKSSQLDENSGVLNFAMQFSPNVFADYQIFSYDEFKRIVDDMATKAGLKDYRLSRVDFKIDYYDNDFEEYLKLNKLIILLISLQTKIKNRYQSHDPLTQDELTIRIQNKRFEVENYNKDIESGGNDKAKSRLEFRSKSLLSTNKDIPALLNDWIKRLEALPDYYDELQKICNEKLIEQWLLEKDGKVHNISEFVRKYQDNIYSSGQLCDLFKRLGKSEKTAYNFQAENHIQYFTRTDLKKYIKLLKESLLKFTTNDSNLEINRTSEKPENISIKE